MIRALFDVSGAEWISQENSDYRVRLEISCITLLARLIHQHIGFGVVKSADSYGCFKGELQWICVGK